MPGGEVEAAGPLLEVLSEAQRRGLVGPGAVEEHIRHAEGFLTAFDVADGLDGLAVDLGSGGGIPGLILALRRPDSRWLLLDSRERAAAFLGEAVKRLQLGRRVEVRQERAEVTGRSEIRATASTVVARSFGPPAVVAECAAPLLRTSGVLVVSNPPGSAVEDLWPPAAVAQLGLGAPRLVAAPGSSFSVLEQVTTCPDRYPRRVGVPEKRRLF